MPEEVIDVEAEEIGTELAVATQSPTTALVAREEIDVSELLQQSEIVHQAMVQAMTNGVHYGLIPGVNKPTLLKPGAEKLLVLFRLAPAYESEKIWHEDGHLTVIVKCVLHHIPTGLKIAEGEGLCTTRESRYAWRQGGRLCPECNQPAIIKGKAEYGGGWICFGKKGGCGAKWSDDSEQASLFENASLDRVPNPDLPDSFNTVLKMGDKRALLAAILNGTAASDVFTQDMEDMKRDDAASATDSTASNRPAAKPPEEVVFHPASVLRKDAPTTRQGWKGVMSILNEIDPSIEWNAIIEQAIKGFFGAEFSVKEAEPKQKTEAFYRVANAAGRLSELFTESTFLEEKQVQDAFGEMFEGVLVEVKEFHEEQQTIGHVGTAGPDE